MKLLKAKEGGENVQILLASRLLERTLRTIQVTRSPNLDIARLKDIAGIRAALDVLSTYLSEDFVGNFERLDAFPKCLETAKHLCGNSSRFVIQLFLLKQLVRHDPNGIDAVKERCKRNELKWIMPPQSEVRQFLLLCGLFLVFFETLQHCDKWRKFTLVSDSVIQS